MSEYQIRIGKKTGTLETRGDGLVVAVSRNAIPFFYMDITDVIRRVNSIRRISPAHKERPMPDLPSQVGKVAQGSKRQQRRAVLQSIAQHQAGRRRDDRPVMNRQGLLFAVPLAGIVWGGIVFFVWVVAKGGL
jgi:hypothetical protein